MTTEAEEKGLAPRPRGMISPRFIWASPPVYGYLKVGGLDPDRVRTAKSGRKWRAPVRYDHFRITTMERDATDNLVPDKTIHDKIGPKPDVVPIVLLYDDPHLNMPTQFTCYAGTTRYCYGDGETALRRQFKEHQGPNGKEIEWLNAWDGVKCPCPYLNERCKPVGTLRCLLPDAERVGGCYQFRTTSWNSIASCLNSMELIRCATADVGGILRGLPLHLRLVNRPIHTPQGNVVMPIVHLEFAGQPRELWEIAASVVTRRLAHKERTLAVEQQQRALLGTGLPLLSPEEDAATAQEFFPDTQAELPPSEPTEPEDDEKAMNTLGWSEERKEQFRVQFPDFEERMAALAKEQAND